jgi:hypothetical protein
MKEIKLTTGQTALVDDEDFEEVNKYKWYAKKNANGTLYAITEIWHGRKSVPRKTRIRMHRLIMKPADNMKVDHKNHNGLDNRKDNLRVCTTAENTRNKQKKAEYIIQI